MKWLAGAIVLFSALVATPLTLAQQRIASLGFEVRDANNADPLSASVYVDGEKVGPRYVLPQGSESSIAMEVRADAGAGYYTRTMTIFLEAINQDRAIFRIYLAPRNSSPMHNRASVANASRFLQPGNVDRAIALLESIVEETSPALKESQFGLYLKYNLWRAYFIGCTQKFLDYCSDASDIQRELLRISKNRPDYFLAERVTTEELLLGSREILDSKLRLDYHRAKWDLRRNRPEDALVSLKQLIRATEEDAKLLGRLRITREDLDLLFAEATGAKQPS